MSVFPCSLLVDLPNWLGDVVLALPTVERLIQANTAGRTYLLLPEALAPVFASLKADVLPRPRHASWLWAKEKLAGRFQVAITFRHSSRAKLLLWGCGAQEGLSSRGRGAELLGLRTFFVDRQQHQTHDFNEALGFLHVAPVNGQAPRLPLAAVLPRDKHKVVLSPGSHSYPAKRYPKKDWLLLGKMLQEKGLSPLVLVGRREEELGAFIARGGGGKLLPPGLGLDRVIELLQSVDVVVGNDSGLTHLAAACGCRVVALFGPTSPSRTAPPGALVLQAPEFARYKWALLPPENIAAAVFSLLDGPTS